MLILGLLALISAVWLGMRAGDSPSVEVAPPADRQASGVSLQGPLSQAPEPAVIEGDAPVIPDLPPGLNTTTKAMTPEPPTLSGPEVIEQWLSSSTDIPTIVRTVLDGFPKLSPADHLLAASKVTALADDANYEGVKRLLVDSRTSDEAKEFLYRDAFNRGAEVKLPTMFAVMTTPGHPQAAEAREALANHLGADYGANQGQWLAHIQANLKERAEIGK